jgi:glycosyltransferase involved in cell wall biosynthesis
VPDQQPEILADRLQFLLQVEPLRRAFGRRATAAAQKYAWSRVADDIIDLYMRLGANVKQTVGEEGYPQGVSLPTTPP